MKRQDLIRHLRQHGCVLAREGAAHSIWENPANSRRTSVPRHREIPELAILRESIAEMKAGGGRPWRAVLEDLSLKHGLDPLPSE